MAVLDRDPRKYDGRTRTLLQSGPVLIFRRQHQILTDNIIHLKELGFVVHEIDSREQANAADMNNAILFKCRENHRHYPNINSIQFWDLFVEVKVPEQGGLILVLWHFDEYMRRDESYYQDLLRILVGYHYTWLLFGLQFRVLIQSDDPSFKLTNIWSVNAHAVMDVPQEAPRATSQLSARESGLSPEQREVRRQRDQKWIRKMIGQLEAQLANSDNLTSINRRDIQQGIENLTRSLARYEELEEE
jgi:hypothetical protein